MTIEERLAKVLKLAEEALPDDSAEHYNALRDIVEILSAPQQDEDPFCPRHGRASRPVEIPGLRCTCAAQPRTSTRVKLWAQYWEESERGWGVRPDGYTLHTRREHVALFLKDMREREAKQYGGRTPDEYSRPSGEPFEIETANSKVIVDVYASAFGIWGPGHRVEDLNKDV